MTSSSEKKTRSGLRAALPWLLVAAAVGLWTFWDPGSSPLQGQAAPALRVPSTHEGGTFDLAERRGHVVVLAFWATWCPACRHEGPILSRLQERIAAHGDEVVGLSTDAQALPDIARAADQLEMSYPIAKVSRADVDRFGVEVLPTLFVIAPDGTVAASFDGPVGESRLLEAVEHARDRRLARTP